MSLLWTESFVGWATPVGIYQLPLSPHAPAVGTGPNGQNVYFLQGSATLPKIVGTPATVGVGLRMKMTYTTAGPARFLQLQDTGAEQITLLVDVAGRIVVMRGAAILGQSPPGVIVLGAVWHYITLDASIGAAGSVLVKVNGVTVLDLAPVNTQQTANAYLTTVVFGATATNIDTTICDVYITDAVVAGAEPVATIGDVRIVALRPSGAGSNAQFAPVGAAANWQAVDDPTVPDDDATYNASATVGLIDSFVTPGMAGPVVPTTVPAVFVKTYVRKDDAGVRSLAAAVKLGAATAAAAGTPVSAGYAWQADKFATDPAGAAWTKANVNAAEFGYKLIA